MRFFRKVVGERLYLSPFDADDAEMHIRWAGWMKLSMAYRLDSPFVT
ncbi:MAG: hypothetical protein LBC83_01005 [Oscillospiraceae bacterium]|jgi:hypothetical protein|nr:hypothetical protein [Oscillospiraceae bacterium]